MTKTFHFMAGLPRSGSTVLSALLNQHSEIYASAQTDLIDLLYQAQSRIPNYESYKANLYRESYERILRAMPEMFYSHVEKPIVIDKNRSWGVPYNFDYLSPIVNKNGKVILTLRPIIEILASLIRKSNDSYAITGKYRYLEPEMWASQYRDTNDAQAEYLMRANGEIDTAIWSIYNLIQKHSNRVCVVWYSDLIKNPQQTLDNIYSFLEVKSISNNLENIVAVDNHDDLNAYGLVGLHDVRSKLSVSTTKTNNYLSKHIINKYSNYLDFLGV